MTLSISDDQALLSGMARYFDYFPPGFVCSEWGARSIALKVRNGQDTHSVSNYTQHVHKNFIGGRIAVEKEESIVRKGRIATAYQIVVIILENSTGFRVHFIRKNVEAEVCSGARMIINSILVGKQQLSMILF